MNKAKKGMLIDSAVIVLCMLAILAIKAGFTMLL
jgi:hypothetical protein